MSSLLYSGKETTLVAEQIQRADRYGLLGTDTVTVSWEERKLQEKRKKERKKITWDN